METQPFYKSNLESVSLWGKMRGQKSEKNAVLEINNLLSEKPLLDVTPADVLAIVNKYELNLYTDFTDGSLRELYKAYLRYCFDDNHLNEEEINRLRHLKHLLGLSDKDIDLAHHRVCQEVHGRELETALADQRLDEKERRFLKDLQTKLQLPAEVTQRVQQHKATSIVMEFIIGAITDEPLSAEEEEELNILGNHVTPTPQSGTSTRKQLAKYRLLWQLENEGLPTIYVPLEFPKEESCCFLANATWHDAPDQILIAQPKPIRTKLAERNYWQPLNSSAPFNGQPDKAEKGKIYLTNQRLIYRVNEQEKTIQLDNILNFQPYSDGIAVLRGKGRHVMLAMDNHSDVLAILLGRILRDR
ncbi:hypothetical protein [Tunicatimonas pelagia]|uniref:hypothetical protein n=1 Tax=Tunicatimonas pelagia TaxID=931531 RepID=UPI002666A534|nr:hypothetical protein [Tunicatimonas pelagia]WKN42357.1 hypothetical protein P0M28_25305 [Tunicatimonas pelagia]